MAIARLIATAILAIAMTMAPTLPAYAVEVHRDDVPDMMEACQRERQRNIEPLRKQAVEDCVSKGMRSREDCERRNRNFGERMRNADGTTRPGLFWNLPLCQQADAADRYFRANPGKDTYSLE